MLLRRLSIRSRITTLAGLCLLLIVTLLVVTNQRQSNEGADLVEQASAVMLEEGASLHLQTLGEQQAALVQRYFMDAYQYGRGFQRQILFLREQAQKRAIEASYLREDLTYQAHSSLESNADLAGLYVIFEPGALDGSDTQFVGRGALGTNDDGRFALYWRQLKPGDLRAEVFSEAQLAVGNQAAHVDRYNCALASGHECVLEPYWDRLGDRQVLMTSIVFPLKLEGKVVGVLGVDLDLGRLQGEVERAGAVLYEGEGALGIFSPVAQLAAYSRDSAMIGQTLDQLYAEQAGQLLQLFKAESGGQRLHADRLQVTSRFQPIPGAEAWSVLIDVPRQVLLARADELVEQLGQQRSKASLQAWMYGLIAVVLGLLLMRLAANGVIRPILDVAAMLTDIASGNGDLTRRLHYDRKDELGQLACGFNSFLDKLQPIIADIKVSVLDARDTADRSSLIASQTSSGMQQQYREVEQVATAVQQMSATAQTVASNAAQAADAAQDADQASGEGKIIIARTTSSMEQLASGMSLAMGEVEGLAHGSERVGTVLKVIRDIAEQTNLLALNAAIEAARAGDAGRGFAVVADEVRGLARRTQESVEEIRVVIETLQSDIHKVVAGMRSSHALASGSVQQVECAVAALDSIGRAVSVITEMNLQIASAAEEQSSVADEVSRSVASMREVSESIASQAEESARINLALNQMASHQQRLVGSFQV